MLPSATPRLPPAPTLPSAAPATGSMLQAALSDPRIGCTSLNFSMLPPGSPKPYRATAYASGAGIWVKGFGHTPEEALAAMMREVK